MTSPHSVANRRRPMMVAPVLVVAALILLLAALIAVPPFGMAMLAGSVVATELSPFVALAALLWCLPAARLLGGRRPLRMLVISLLVLAAADALIPFTQFAHVATRAATQLGDGEATHYSLMTTLRGLPSNASVVDHVVHYSAADGSPLVMHRYALAANSPQPVVVVIYGGAWQSGESTQLASTSRALASRGFGVVSIDYRHAPQFQWSAQLDDIRRSIALIRDSSTAWGLEPTRMALLGRSAGGQLAELAAYAPDAPPVRAVVAFYAPHDLVEGYRDLPLPDPIGVRSVLRDFLGGTPETASRAYHDASPSSWVHRGMPPTLLLYGGRDHVVKPEFNRDAGGHMRQKGVRAIIVELPWAEHGFDMVPTGLGGQLSFDVVIRFLKQELEP